MSMGGKSCLPTEPGTQLSWSTSRPWCAGHPWRSRNRALGWAHRIGHRARVLRNQAPRHQLVYLEGKPEDGGDFPCCAPMTPRPTLPA